MDSSAQLNAFSLENRLSADFPAGQGNFNSCLSDYSACKEDEILQMSHARNMIANELNNFRE